MTRHADVADDATIWAMLPLELRAALDTAQHTMGMPAGSALAIPALRTYLTSLAACRLASTMNGLSATEAFASACERLHIEDDSALDTRPSDSLLRTLRRWRRRADAHVHARSFENS